MPHKKSLAINLNIPYPNNMNITNDHFNTQPQSDEYASEHEEVRGTFAAEPAAEQEPQPYDGWEGCWPGDGSGMDDLADMHANEANDYYDE
jgi:hypothetical protein